MLGNKVKDGRLVRPDPRIRKLFRPENFHVDTKHEVSRDGAVIFGPCIGCKNYVPQKYLDPAVMGACKALDTTSLYVKAGDKGCTMFQPTEEAERYAKQQGR